MPDRDADPRAHLAEQLEELAAELRSGSGRVRHLVVVFGVELGLPTIPPGPGMLRCVRDDIAREEPLDVLKQATKILRVQRHIQVVSHVRGPDAVD